MNKYISLKAVIPYLPRYIKEEESESQLLSWALLGYRQNITVPAWKDDFRVCLATVTNNRAKLPFGINKIISIGYSKNKPCKENDTTQQWFDSMIDNDFVLLSQDIAYQNLKRNLQTLRYVGQNPELLTFGCANLFSKCNINFSVDKQLKYVTLDEPEGYLVIVYSSSVTEDGDYLIPDDADLLQALAYYVEARHWHDRAARKEESTEGMFQQRLLMADNKFREFRNKQVLRKFNADGYKQQLLDRFNSLHVGATIINDYQ